MIKIGVIEQLAEAKDLLASTNDANKDKKKKKLKLSDIKKIKETTLGDGSDSSRILFENTLLVQTKKAGMDWINDQMFFGVMMPVRQPKVDDEGEVIGEEIKPRLTWVFDNKQHRLLTMIYKKQNNIEIDGELTEIKARWNLKKLQEWIHDSKVLPYPTLKAKDLFERIRKQFKKYIWFDDEQYYNILPLWVLGTYCYQLFQCYPYINLWGLKNTGKTKVMQLSAIISFNSQVFINMSVASLFRIIQLDSPTLFIDEAENLWQQQQKGDDETSEIVACLNAGWMKGSQVPRIEKVDNVQKIVKFDVYCPKMLASIKGLKGALDTRCIRLIMIRPQGQPVSQLWFDEDDKELLDLRNEIYPFILENWGVIKAYYSGNKGLCVENKFNIDNRDWQIWKPLLAIAKLVSDDLVKEVGEWAGEECEMNKDEEVSEDSWETKIFGALFKLVQSEELSRYYMKDITKAVHGEFIDRTYFDNYKNKEIITYLKEKPSGAFVGKLFNKIGFKKNKFKSGERGYWLNKGVVKKVLFGVSGNQIVGQLDGSDTLDGTGGHDKSVHNSQNDVTTPFISEKTPYTPVLVQSVQSVQVSNDNIILIIHNLKDSLHKLPSFNDIKATLLDYGEEELSMLLKKLEFEGRVYQPKPDQYEVL